MRACAWRCFSVLPVVSTTDDNDDDDDCLHDASVTACHKSHHFWYVYIARICCDVCCAREVSLNWWWLVYKHWWTGTDIDTKFAFGSKENMHKDKHKFRCRRIGDEENAKKEKTNAVGIILALIIDEINEIKTNKCTRNINKFIL